MKASATLHPAASKHLIARGVAAHPSVRAALERGTIVVTLGTTNAHVADELLGTQIDHGAFAAGVIDGRWNVNERIGEATDVVIRNGARIEFDGASLLESLAAGDVVIKGGNALDPFGTVGVLMASPTGGTVGRYIPSAMARGVETVIPISVAKSIHAPISELSLEMGSGAIERADGIPCGLFPLVGHVVTEIEALSLLYGVRALHVASGGVGPGVGSVSLLIDGERDAVTAACDALDALKEATEPAVRGRP